MKNFGITIIGDEILSGKRQDAHLSFVVQALKARGLQLAWANYLGDIPEQITATLKASMARGDVVFSFGGIGATPDDFTRQCAADAVGVPIVRHPLALAEIEAQYGDTAYPKRVLMADFPQGANIVPGFPQMAHPMMEWVLDTHYASLFHQQDYIEASILVTEAGESRLIDLMQSIVKRYPDLKLFSLPKLDQHRSTELGVKGPAQLVHTAMVEIKQGVSALNFPWTDL
jgi:molybdopterin-biosynthesis enzyme MoeA-like protein